MNSRRWRLEEIDNGCTVAHGGWRGSMVEMNSIPWSPVLRYATPLPMNRTPVSTVGGPFPPFCGTPDPSRSTVNRIPFQTWPVEHKAVSFVLRYARPRFHRLFRPSPLDEHATFCCLPMNTTHSVASP